MAIVPSGRPTGLPPAEHDPTDLPVTMDERHADFVASHVQVDPDPLPQGAAAEVPAVVEHLHAVVEVLDVIETVEAEGRLATDEEVQQLQGPQAVLAASELPPVTE